MGDLAWRETRAQPPSAAIVSRQPSEEIGISLRGRDRQLKFKWCWFSEDRSVGENNSKWVGRTMLGRDKGSGAFTQQPVRLPRSLESGFFL